MEILKVNEFCSITVKSLKDVIDYIRLYLGDDVADYLENEMLYLNSATTDLLAIEHFAKNAGQSIVAGDTTEALADTDEIISIVRSLL